MLIGIAVFVTYHNYSKKRQISKILGIAKTQICTLETQLAKYKKSNGIHPKELSYLGKISADPWGSDLVYERVDLDTTQKSKFTLYSKGPNTQDDQGKGDDVTCSD